jgi:hypothetical protein
MKKARTLVHAFIFFWFENYAGDGPPLGGGAEVSEATEFTTSFNSLLGLKNGIFFAGTSTRSPVFGLRPTRGLR